MGEFVSTEKAHYTLAKKVAELGHYKDGSTKDITLGYWFGELRLDIRTWKDGALGKGITLNEEEVRLLRKALAEVNFGMPDEPVKEEKQVGMRYAVETADGNLAWVNEEDLAAFEEGQERLKRGEHPPRHEERVEEMMQWFRRASQKGKKASE